MNNLKEFDRHKQTYRSEIDDAVAFSGQSHDFFTRVKAEYLIELLERVGSEPTQGILDVLDIGCGHGHIHPYLTRSKLNLKLTGIDVASTVIEEARSANPGVSYRDYDGDRLPFADCSFDAAYAIAVMHHVPPPQWPAFLVEMRRVVRPGGLIIVFEHNPINPFTQWIVRTCPIDDNAVLLSNRRLSKLVSRVDFCEIESRYILFTPLDGPRYRAFDKAIGWLPLGAQYYVSARVPRAA